MAGRIGFRASHTREKVAAQPLSSDSTGSKRILILTEDAIAKQMAGPAIRAWEIAGALARSHEVVLATTSGRCERRSAHFEAEQADEARITELEAWCDVVLVQGYVLSHFPVLRPTSKTMVVDLYDPIHFEVLDLAASQPEPERSAGVAHSVAVVREQLERGDFFVCASDRQRDLWLGALASLGRVNPATYGQDPTLRRLIDVVPFGLPDEPPRHLRPVLRGVVPGIGAGDDLLLWGGGIYDWLDPLTLVLAVSRLRRRRPNVRLFFLGTRHPNPVVEPSKKLVEAEQAAASLGLIGRHVFFHDGWVPYEERQSYLLEADIGVSLHEEHVEASYSFRTRILDYLWAGLPIVATRGDSFAELIASEGLGKVVPGGDPAAVEAALYELLSDSPAREACHARALQVSQRFRWSEALRPIVAFCSDPHRAADQTPPEARAQPTPAAVPPASPLRRAALAYRRGGLRAVTAGAARRLRGR